MGEDFLKDWVESDPQLNNILIDIENTDLSAEEQAETMFLRVSDLYNLPKMPEDINYDNELAVDDDYELNSVFMELGLLKILYQGEDIRTLVLLALYYVRNRINVNTDEVFKVINSNRLKDVGIGFKGSNSYVQTLIISRGSKSWTELGCIAFIKQA
ncbi:hypothetical protein [Flavobacterium sp. NRK1]|uniref:hypothetical protein n=1 Tax=Flavobacterium sp. NRK1 TaxID=2954929 RepID=UPI00209374B9|nr:hypothetical protein [Flavobacterium sp. NRK1]MCO6148882.1 hypothetical protein [Flavobacterium sp. NRK1]